MISNESRAIVEQTVHLVREHGTEITGVFYDNMFAAHPELTNLFNMSNQANGGQKQALASAVYAYAANIDNREALAPILQRIAHKHASLGILPSQYTIVGKHLLGAIKHVLGDLATPEILAAWDETYWLLACELIAIEAGLYTQKDAQVNEHYWRPFTVAGITEETSTIRSLTLKPSDGGTLPDFKAGQYVSVALEQNGRRQIRQYSLSKAPGSDEWRITVKREDGRSFSDEPAGVISNQLHQLEVGATISVGIPYGDFTLDEQENPVVLVSAGVGITPMISILKDLAQQNIQQTVRAYHAVKSVSEVALWLEAKEALSSLPNARGALFCEAGDAGSSAFQGRMHLTATDTEALPKDTVFYICGPIGFMQSQRQWILDHGFDAGQIRYEVFGPDLFAGLQ